MKKFFRFELKASLDNEWEWQLQSDGFSWFAI